MKNNTNKNAAGRLHIPKGTYARRVMMARMVMRDTEGKGSAIPNLTAKAVMEASAMARFMGTELSILHRQRFCPHMFWNNGNGTWTCIMCELEGHEDGEGEPLKGVNL